MMDNEHEAPNYDNFSVNDNVNINRQFIDEQVSIIKSNAIKLEHCLNDIVEGMKRLDKKKSQRELTLDETHFEQLLYKRYNMFLSNGERFITKTNYGYAVFSARAYTEYFINQLRQKHLNINKDSFQHQNGSLTINKQNQSETEVLDEYINDVLLNYSNNRECSKSGFQNNVTANTVPINNGKIHSSSRENNFTQPNNNIFKDSKVDNHAHESDSAKFIPNINQDSQVSYFHQNQPYIIPNEQVVAKKTKKRGRKSNQEKELMSNYNLTKGKQPTKPEDLHLKNMIYESKNSFPPLSRSNRFDNSKKHSNLEKVSYSIKPIVSQERETRIEDLVDLKEFSSESIMKNPFRSSDDFYAKLDSLTYRIVNTACVLASHKKSNTSKRKLTINDIDFVIKKFMAKYK